MDRSGSWNTFLQPGGGAGPSLGPCSAPASSARCAENTPLADDADRPDGHSRLVTIGSPPRGFRPGRPAPPGVQPRPLRAARRLRHGARRGDRRSLQGRDPLGEAVIALARGRRVRHDRIGRLVQRSPAARTHRQRAAGRGRSSLLCSAGGRRDRSMPATRWPQGSPGRLISADRRPRPAAGEARSFAPASAGGSLPATLAPAPESLAVAAVSDAEPAGAAGRPRPAALTKRNRLQDTTISRPSTGIALSRATSSGRASRHRSPITRGQNTRSSST